MNSKLDLRKTSQLPDFSGGDEQVILSDGEVAIATSTAEKLLDRSSGESGGAGILRKSSKNQEGFITLIIVMLVTVITCLVFVYLRVKGIKN